MPNRTKYAYESDLGLALAEFAPRSLLAVGPNAALPLAGYQFSHPETQVLHITEGDWLAQVDATQRFDFVFLSEILEHLPRNKAYALIARLRDLHSQRLYALVPLGKAWLNHSSHWEQNDLIGIGLDLVNVYADRGRPVGLFKFDLRTYKTTPEWFNSKYWAHPELWDKH